MSPVGASRITRALKSPVIWLELLLVLAWAGVLYTSFESGARPSAASGSAGKLELLTAAGEGQDAEWSSVSLQGRKVGCGFSDRVRVADGYRLQERSYLRLRAFEQDREVTTTFVARTDLQQRLRSFSFQLSAAPSVIEVHGDVRGQGLELEIVTGGERRKERVPMAQIPEISLTYRESIARRSPKVGETLEIPYFDPATFTQQQMQVKVLEQGTAKVDGREVKTWTLESGFKGVSSRAVVTEDGRTLEESNALGMKLVRVTRDEALYQGWPDGASPVDVIALSAVSVKTPLPDARSLVYLDAHLSGGGVEVLLGRPEEGSKPGDVTIRVPQRPEWKTYPIPLMDPRFSAELASSTLLQAEDPKIRSVAQSVVGDALNALEASQRLNAWVFERLKKAPVMGVPSALEVLKMGEGDCNEHATLFTALARSVGIPTRMVAGIVYSDQTGGGAGFYYHAWSEVYLGVWVPVDPTFGQFPADATHIRLVEGELKDQLSLIRVVGNLQIDIKEAH